MTASSIRRALLAIIAACILCVGMSVPAYAGDTATTSTTIELGPATSVTRAPNTGDIEVKGKQVVADDGTSWGWWMLLLVGLPALGLVYGLTRQRLATARSSETGS